MSNCQCYQIGGPFISEDPDCPEHGTEGRERQEKAERYDDLLSSVRKLVGDIQDIGEGKVTSRGIKDALTDFLAQHPEVKP